ncbi:ATP-binding protein [Bradyrhizobium sp. Ash2021]|uniref:ATP-binding protein n=1 Tax=Bradyrhizobium sp. Ash2021 TaxID=2954771 RepID=UPI002814CB78|nr:ATP-binding protein [Bradyrhizobium sp. Ash2021]WMT77026.1 ATP-binding protein [Bradyrhizobium sp. Ash2021]
MRLENKASEIELIAKAFQAISREKGDGLGLSICRKIVAVHGGRLWMEENTTHGATFTFTLPLRQSVQMSRSH